MKRLSIVSIALVALVGSAVALYAAESETFTGNASRLGSTDTDSDAAASGMKLTELGRIAKQDYLTPVRPGEPGKSPFWNKNSRQFMYVPSFDFPLVESANFYQFPALPLGFL